MSLPRLLVLAALVLSAPLSAQGRRAPAPAMPSFELKARDIEELGSARLVLEQAKQAGQLELDKDQLTKLTEIRKAFDSDAKRWSGDVNRQQRVLLSRPPTINPPSDERPRTKKDSLERARKDSSNLATADAYMASQAAARRELGAILLKIRADYDAAVNATTALLTETQNARVTALLDAASSELTFRLRRANIR